MENYFLQHEYIDSVKYRKKIKELFDSSTLFEKTGITNFCICISFRDDKKYFLSNMPDWAIQWYKIGGSRADEVFNLELMKNKNHFIPRDSDYDVIQNSFVIKEQNEYGYFDTYSLIRRCTDCTFVLLTLHNIAVDEPRKIYEKTFQVRPTSSATISH